MKSYDFAIRAEFTALTIAVSFFEKWHNYKGAYLQIGGSSGLLV